VRHVLPAERAELLEFQPFRGELLVLHAGVVLALAIPTLKSNLFACHYFLPIMPPAPLRQRRQGRHASGYSKISDTVPAPTVRPPSRIAKRNPLSMATGVISSTSSCTLSPGITISIPAGNCATPVTSVVRK